MTDPLHTLLTDSFRAQVAYASTPSVLRRALFATPEVQELRTAIRSGALREQEIRQSVGALLEKYERGVRFEDDFAVAAVAAALETHHSMFAAEYLRDLASLRLAELALATGVAKESLKNRPSIAYDTRDQIITSLDAASLQAESRELLPNCGFRARSNYGDALAAA